MNYYSVQIFKTKVVIKHIHTVLIWAENIKILFNCKILWHTKNTLIV